jgi:hypothetical protein
MRMIPPGKECEKVIDENIKAADIIVLLVSADFMASDFFHGPRPRRTFFRAPVQKSLP